ncbi:MAG: imidazole glycerol phosphate synthase subunit HisH [Solirubrobacterales bacterium]
MSNGDGARIVILDYGMGNLRSVEKALEHIGVAAEISADPERASTADGLILPGVGAFPKAMERVRELELDRLVAQRLGDGIPVLGICLGLQLLFSSSTELGGAQGLGLLSGEVRELESGELKVPHIGWSPVRWEQASPLSDGIDDETPFYFVHSFTPYPGPAQVLGSAVYDERFACAAWSGSLYGVQFHPEKSGAAGLRLLSNFAGICARAPATA